MLRKNVLLGFALLCCSCATAQDFQINLAASLQPRDRRSIDVGWLVRNLLLNSATASDLQANATRNAAANVQIPPPAPPRRPASAPATTRRPKANRQPPPPPQPPAPSSPAPPAAPPAQPAVHPLINLFAGSSSFWKLPPPTTTTTTTTTTTEAPVTLAELPPPRGHRPGSSLSWNGPGYGSADYDYYYPSGYETFVERGVPAEYEFSDGFALRGVPPPPPLQRKVQRNRQRPAAAAAPPAPAPPPPQPPARPEKGSSPVRRRPAATVPSPPTAKAPAPAPIPAGGPAQPQRARVLYQYFQGDDTSYNDNNDDDANELPAPAPKPQAQQQDDNSDEGQNDAQGKDVPDGRYNVIRTYGPAPPFDDFSVHHQPYAESPSKLSFGGSKSYFGGQVPVDDFGAYSASAGIGTSGFGGSRHASPAKGVYKFRDAFSDFET